MLNGTSIIALYRTLVEINRSECTIVIMDQLEKKLRKCVVECDN